MTEAVLILTEAETNQAIYLREDDWSAIRHCGDGAEIILHSGRSFAVTQTPRAVMDAIEETFAGPEMAST
jgi:hypothetical protein